MGGGERREPHQIGHQQLHVHGPAAAELVGAVAPLGREGEPHPIPALDRHMPGVLEAQQGDHELVGPRGLALRLQPLLHLGAEHACVGDVEQCQQHLRGEASQRHGPTVTYYYVSVSMTLVTPAVLGTVRAWTDWVVVVDEG
jgi:hypothetical protein